MLANAHLLPGRGFGGYVTSSCCPRGAAQVEEAARIATASRVIWSAQRRARPSLTRQEIFRDLLPS